MYQVMHIVHVFLYPRAAIHRFSLSDPWPEDADSDHEAKRIQRGPVADDQAELQITRASKPQYTLSAFGLFTTIIVGV